MWNERYSQPGYIYGTKPNDFLVSMSGAIPPGRVLCLAEGEGRNAVFLASCGYEVVAVDSSEVGLEKAQQLAVEQGVTITTVLADLRDYPIEPASWEGIVSIFCHLPRELRVPLHSAVVRGLKPGGVFILEGFTPQQLGRGTGGPPNVELLMSLADLRTELAGLKMVHACEIVREVVEGTYHTGLASVVQIVGAR
ncbi:MAG: methyltransferase domain-containing protein [Geobacter sp.]|nr:methyltransferase domain-containing protein [Geobacter sp.]